MTEQQVNAIVEGVLKHLADEGWLVDAWYRDNDSGQYREWSSTPQEREEVSAGLRDVVRAVVQGRK